MKAVISNRIYIGSESPLAPLKDKLTYVLNKPNASGKPTSYTFLDYKVVSKKILSIPSGRHDLLDEECEIVDKRVAPSAEFPEFKFSLRPDQKEICEDVSESCIINANPSWGKTFCGIYIAARLGLKTLVVVHTKALLDQWIEEVEKTLGIAAGVITAGKLINPESSITIGNVQTLAKFSNDIRKDYGLLIVDECHHTPATTFTSLVDSSHAKYKIGLSGTLGRKDGLHVLLINYFSPKIYTPERANRIEPVVLRVAVPVAIPPTDTWANRVNEVLNNPDYQQTVLNVIAEAIRIGHTVLCVSDRVELLEFLHEMFEEESVLITGGVVNRQELIAEVFEGRKKILFGTAKIFSEGISVNNLSCLVPAMLMNNEFLLDQLIGRIVRIHPNKPKPLVIDFILEGGTAKRQSANRMKFYLEQGFEVVNGKMGT